MPKFRKRPVVIEAMPASDLEAVQDWVENGGGVVELVYPANSDRPTSGYVETLEGYMHFGPQDWIIKGVEGEFYPVRGDIFAKTYEPVED